MQDTPEARLKRYYGMEDRVFTPEEQAQIDKAAQGMVEYGISRQKERKKRLELEKANTP